MTGAMLKVGREDRKSEEEIHPHVTRLLPDVELLVSVIREERRGVENPACEQRPSGKTRDTVGPAANTPGTLNCSGRKAGLLASLSL